MEPETKRVQVIRKFNRLFRDHPRARTFVIYGGAGSGKSVAVAQHICRMMIEQKDVKILVTRKTLPSLKITAYQLIKDIFAEWGIVPRTNKTDHYMILGSNKIFFKSIDDPEKIKSAEFNYAWVEEATEITKEDYMQIRLRLRRANRDPTRQNQIYLTFNPIDAHHWLIEDLVEGPRNPRTVINHSTYKDNPFLPAEYVEELEGLINQDENYYRIYTLGVPGVLEGLIYKNYTIEEPPTQVGLFVMDADAIGLDFGFNNQTAMVAIRYYEGEFYIKELFYKSGYTNSDLIAWMKANLPNKSIPIYADAAEPDRIEDIARAGFNCWPAKKEVVPGIDYIKAQKLHITPESVNVIKEIRNYKWGETRDKKTLDEPVKYMDHAMDAMRYAMHTMGAGRQTIPIEAATKKRDEGAWGEEEEESSEIPGI